MGKLWGREPALIIGFVNAVVALAVGFGLDWTGDQVSLVMAAVAALLAVVTRTQVTATKQIAPPSES